MNKIKCCFAGAGFIANYHARGLIECEGVELISVMSATEKRAKEFADKYNLSAAYTDYSRMLAESNADLVIISTPNKFHYPYTIQALNAGMHVFVEKPMACSVEEAKEMKELAELKNVALMVGHMWRFDNEVQFLAQKVAKGDLGSVFKTTGYSIHENWGPAGWFVRKELAWGGALADMGIHAIDTTRFILGDPKPVRVFGKVGNYVKNFEVEDSAIAMIEWDNGCMSVIESGWWHPHMEGPEASAKVYGSEGFGNLFPTFIKKSGEESTEKSVFPTREEHCPQIMFTLQMKEMLAAIKEGRQPVPGGLEGFINMVIVDSVYRSSEGNRSIDI
jgi:predicted dehydrogenase